MCSKPITMACLSAANLCRNAVLVPMTIIKMVSVVKPCVLMLCGAILTDAARKDLPPSQVFTFYYSYNDTGEDHAQENYIPLENMLSRREVEALIRGIPDCKRDDAKHKLWEINRDVQKANKGCQQFTVINKFNIWKSKTIGSLKRDEELKKKEQERAKRAAKKQRIEKMMKKRRKGKRQGSENNFVFKSEELTDRVRQLKERRSRKRETEQMKRAAREIRYKNKHKVLSEKAKKALEKRKLQRARLAVIEEALKTLESLPTNWEEQFVIRREISLCNSSEDTIPDLIDKVTAAYVKKTQDKLNINMPIVDAQKRVYISLKAGQEKIKPDDRYNDQINELSKAVKDDFEAFITIRCYDRDMRAFGFAPPTETIGTDVETKTAQK